MFTNPGDRARGAPDVAWERRLDRWRAGDIDLTDDEHERFMAEHADMNLISRYLGDDLGPAERAQVEARARTDAAFRLDLHIINAMDGRVRAGLHDATLFRLHETENARRSGRRLMLASFIVVAGMLMTAAVARLNDVRTWIGERFGDRAITADFSDPRSVVTASADSTLALTLTDIAVRRGSKLTMDSEKSFAVGGGLMALDGEAAFHSWGTAIILRTATSIVHMIAGRYAVRSLPHSGVTLITVDSGIAWIEPLEKGMLDQLHHKTLGVARAGNRAMVTRDGRVTIVGRDSGFPATAFIAPAGSASLDRTPAQVNAREPYARLEPTIRAKHGSWK